MAVRILPGAEVLQALRDQGLTVVAIAERYGVRRAAVNTALAKARARGVKARADAQRAARDAAVVVPEVAAHPDLTVERVAALISTTGRYCELCALAARWDEPLRRVQGWWHRVRVSQ
ncbi:hypothetical protein [Puniceibacterium sp. IMCC21224]|uniref:hypothetical protein n=1 Tax=Puniceibacterium sp. IMCC21224 TaxID=1618204 RepID=UPI00065CD2C1|nr:hypothetical protein [Puniceibacterium sp. IMCC21224]KMK63789.1 hypothetical protein IMCC21224_1924 [Puniceibacterium sp. IMCC21224]